MPSEPQKIYQITFKANAPFDKTIDGLKTEIEAWCKRHDIEVKELTTGFRWDRCRLCGIPAECRTLGNGIGGTESDECRPAHWQSCRRRSSQGGWEKIQAMAKE